MASGKYQVAFRNVDSGKKWSDTHVATFYVNAPIKVIYRAITVDPNTGAKSYSTVDIKDAEVTTNPNGSTALAINVDAKWCESGYHFDHMLLLKASTGSKLGERTSKEIITTIPVITGYRHVILTRTKHHLVRSIRRQAI